MHMTLLNYKDAGKLKTPEAEKLLTPYERKYALVELPSFAQWINYMLFVGAAPFGAPSTEFASFDDFINLRGDSAKMKAFSNFIPAFKRLFQFLLIIGISVTLSAHFSYELLNEQEFKDASMLYKILLVTACGQGKTFQLFVAFIGMEMNCIASGYGYKARTEKEPENFNTIRSVEMIKFLSATRPTQMISNWNMRTQHWMKYYIMVRLIDRTKPRGSGV